MFCVGCMRYAPCGRCARSHALGFDLVHMPIILAVVSLLPPPLDLGHALQGRQAVDCSQNLTGPRNRCLLEDLPSAGVC